jgi:hypothetical protein
MKPLLVLLLLALSACNAIPMSYAEWQAEQARKRACEAAGIEYKSPRQIREEAIETRKAVGDVNFTGTKH